MTFKLRTDPAISELYYVYVESLVRLSKLLLSAITGSFVMTAIWFSPYGSVHQKKRKIVRKRVVFPLEVAILKNVIV